jgi:hypothetical protein
LGELWDFHESNTASLLSPGLLLYLLVVVTLALLPPGSWGWRCGLFPTFLCIAFVSCHLFPNSQCPFSLSLEYSLFFVTLTLLIQSHMEGTINLPSYSKKPLFSWDSLSLYSSNWPWTHDPPAHNPLSAGITCVCNHNSAKIYIYIYIYTYIYICILRKRNWKPDLKKKWEKSC